MATAARAMATRVVGERRRRGRWRQKANNNQPATGSTKAGGGWRESVRKAVFLAAHKQVNVHVCNSKLCVPTKFLLLESERINSRGETIHFRLCLEAQSWQPCISPTDSDDINKLAFPIKYHPFLVDLERGAVRWQVDEMMPSQKRFPLVHNNHKDPAFVARQVCSNKKSLVVI
jgi:hypothetical protein